MHLVLLLWAVQSFCCSVVPEEAKALLCKPFSSDQDIFQSFLETTDLGLPLEIWGMILEECDPASVWNMSMTCRLLASHIREDTNGCKAKYLTPEAVWNIVYYSDLTIQPWMQIYFDRFTEGWRKDVRSGAESEERVGNHLLKIILARAPDAGALNMFFQDRNAPFPEVLLPDCISKNLWSAPSLHTPLPDYPVGQPFVYWIPSVQADRGANIGDDRAYFLDYWSDKQIVAITSQDLFTHLFDPVLLSYYLIPMWKGMVVEEELLKRLKGLSRSAFRHLYDYASLLHAAIYYLTGAIEPDSSWLMAKFYMFFEALGYDVAADLIVRLPTDLEEYDAAVRFHFPIRKILKTAEIWGLDAKELALKYDNAAPIKDDAVRAYRSGPVVEHTYVSPMMVFGSMTVPMALVSHCTVREGMILHRRIFSEDDRRKRKADTSADEYQRPTKRLMIGNGPVPLEAEEMTIEDNLT